MAKIIALTIGILPLFAFADSVNLDESYANDFLAYKPYIKPALKKKTASAVTVQSPSPTPKPRPVQKQQKVTVMWLQKNYPVLEQRAIDDPSDANITAYMYTKRIILDKAQRFEEAIQEKLRTNPFLSENNRIPLASAGSQYVQRANTKAQGKAVKQMAQVGGLVVFVDSKCRFCSMQMPVLGYLKHDFGIEALVISLDGAAPAKYNGPIVKDNGLWRKLKLKLTPSIVYIPHPHGYMGKDTNKYLVISQGYYAADDLTKQMAYAGYRSHILSADIARDLSVWDTGVAATMDLKSLRLDVNNPASFGPTIDPILEKQYENR